jgi:hypothetical protein
LIKEDAKELLNSFGYKLVFENVQLEGKIFEDWWTDSNIKLDWIKE